MSTILFEPQRVATTRRALAVPRILVAEDNESMLDLISRSLRRDGYDVVQARNGVELWACIDQITSPHPVDLPVDLIVTDMRMPGHSGQECLEHLKARDGGIPVIVITGFGDDLVHRLAYAAGARAVFDKPLDLAHLRRAIRVLL